MRSLGLAHIFTVYALGCGDGLLVQQFLRIDPDTGAILVDVVRAPAALLEDMYLAQGEYSVIIGGGKVPLYAGQEYFIPKGLAHAGEYSAGTRTIHAFGGKRAEVDAEM